MIKVREAVDQDADAIAGLLTELGYPTTAPEIPARLQSVTDAPGRVFVAEDAGDVVGVAVGDSPDPAASDRAPGAAERAGGASRPPG